MLRLKALLIIFTFILHSVTYGDTKQSSQSKATTESALYAPCRIRGGTSTPEQAEQLFRSGLKDVIEQPSNCDTNDLIAVGTILPYYAPEFIQIPFGWVIAAGQVIDDPDSLVFYGKQVPNLMGDVFLMGTSNSSFNAKFTGSNELISDGSHNHPESRANRSFSGEAADGSGRTPSKSDHEHNLSIRGDGDHNHGGSNIPNSFGVLYIIKIK